MAAESTASETAEPPVVPAVDPAASETTQPPVAPAVDPAASETAQPPAAPAVPQLSKLAKARADKRRWTSPAQLKWLLGKFPAYLEAQSLGRYDKFWPGFYRDWFEEFPPREPTDNDPSDSEGEIDDDHGSDDDDDDIEEEVDNNAGGASKRKRGTNKGESKTKKKKKKSVSVSCSSCISLTDVCYLSGSNCLRL